MLLIWLRYGSTARLIMSQKLHVHLKEITVCSGNSIVASHMQNRLEEPVQGIPNISSLSS